MPRLKSDGEWVSGAEAARRIGVTAQSLGVWGAKPDAPVKREGGKLLYAWPKFARWREAQLLAERNAKPNDIVEYTRRKMAAEVEMAEMERDEMAGRLVSVDDFRQTVRQITTTIRAQLLAVPGRYAARTVGLPSLPESQRAWDHAVRDILAELQEG